jgi:putative spermidine/putrescine transport system substrate-binding protein
VDLVWVNGENFRTGMQAGVWKCGWATKLPNATFLDAKDPLLLNDFGTPVNGCEAPWHKAQFAIAYDSAKVSTPPTSIPELLTWAQDHPGRFTYPQPPDFTGSAFVRQALYGVSGGVTSVPSTYDAATAQPLEDALWSQLKGVAPSLWRAGQTYPRDLTALDKLYADGQVWFTMTYGPATIDARVTDGTFPATTKVLSMRDGTLGNASFLAIPANAAHSAAAQVVANLALSPEQQAAKADPSTWGQYTVLDVSKVPASLRPSLEAHAATSVVPPFSDLSENSNPELSATWVTPLEQGWRARVLGG